eukprot:TRINITY_DN81037_c0_g1_i1.p1 TRINITY_DN81037_c0_g1~~TRINITY_DN81037_c0_g1_i1.p1  ORF type:complete len:374 (+),score=75.09 TRINITY_DN81037_c0_g1_i1:85-1206(+)
MTVRLFAVTASFVGSHALSQTGERMHCVGNRAHVLKYAVEGDESDGSSMAGIRSAVISMDAAPHHDVHCLPASLNLSRSTPAGDKEFCYGWNQDSTCAAAKEAIPLQTGGLPLDCKDCFVSAHADVYYKLNYSWDHLTSVEVGVKDLHLRGSVALHSHLDGSTTLAKGTKVLSDNSTSYTVIDELVGCPVCVKAKIQLAVPTTLDYEVDLKAQADITAGAELDIHLGDRWVKWDDVVGWTRAVPSREVSAKPLFNIGKVHAEADASVELKTALQINVDDIIWYHVDLTPSLKLKATSDGALWPFHGQQFCLKGDADLKIGHEADLHWNLLTFHENKHWGPVQDYDWSRPGAIHMCKKVGNSSGSNSSSEEVFV